MTVILLPGDCLETLKTIEGGTVQTCVTSPPYYGLRDYGVSGQIGLEETPEAYVDKLVQVFREVRRALADDGTCWLNLGDSYWANRPVNGQSYDDNEVERKRAGGSARPDIKPKDLIGIPWMVAFALRADGWYLRSDIIWHKPNPMPESVTDRPTKSHEYIFLLSKSAQYYYDHEAIKEPATENNWESRLTRDSDKSQPTEKVNGIRTRIKFGGNTGEETGNRTYSGNEYIANGTRNKRDVWTVTTKPYAEAHFATFPPDLIEPCILAGTSEKGECPVCGKAWVRVTEAVGEPQKIRGAGASVVDAVYGKVGKSSVLATGTIQAKQTVGWRPQCECNADPVPQTVLDPFNGSGTTGAVAIKHHRSYIGCELNPDYLELTKRRLNKVQYAMPLPEASS